MASWFLWLLRLQSRQQGVNAEVINIHTIKPLDTELITASAAKTGKVVTEEHSVIGGLGSAVYDTYENAPVPLKVIGVQDTCRTCTSGSCQVRPGYPSVLHPLRIS